MPNKLMFQLYRNMGFSRVRTFYYMLIQKVYYHKLTRNLNRL